MPHRGLHTATCHLGPTRASVVTNRPAVLDHLREFYPLVSGGGTGTWSVEALVGPADPGMITNDWGVSYAADPSTRWLRLRAPEPQVLALTARTCVREVMVDFCERRGYAILHAAAVTDHDRMIVIAGDSGSGKTTLALKGVLCHGMRYLANDHLIMYPTESGLELTTLPGPIGVKVGTYLDLADQLPPPFDTEGLDLDSYRAAPPEQRYRSGDRVVYTYRQLGQPHPATVALRDSGPAVLVALAGYAGAGEPAEEPVGDPVAELLAQVRTDWVFNPRLNQRYLPRAERRPPEYLRDAHRLVRALTERATVVRWRHRGDPVPLLRRHAARDARG